MGELFQKQEKVVIAANVRKEIKETLERIAEEHKVPLSRVVEKVLELGLKQITGKEE